MVVEPTQKCLFVSVEVEGMPGTGDLAGEFVFQMHAVEGEHHLVGEDEAGVDGLLVQEDGDLLLGDWVREVVETALE